MITSRYRFGPFVLDADRRQLERDGRSIALQPKVFSTLLYLVENRTRAVSKEELLEALWPDSFVTEGVLTRSIKQVRAALDDDARQPEYVRTVPRIGYHFIGEAAKEGEPHASDAGLAGDGQAGAPRRQIRTLAVLPFRPLLADRGDPSLELGVADTLINQLSKLEPLIVRPLSAMRRYDGIDTDPLEAGRQQQVDAVIEGSIQQSSDKVRVSMRMLRVTDGRAIWAGQFDQAADDIFLVQDAICERVARALEVELSPRVRDRMSVGTSVPEAYREYLIGRRLLGRHTTETARDSIEHFERALDLDPAYALAHVGLADAYDLLGTLGGPDYGELYEKVRRSAQRALALDPELAWATCSLAKIAWQHDWDFAAADRLFRQALAAEPHHSEILIARADYEAQIGRAERSIELARQALEIDPLSPWVGAMLAQAYHMNQDYELAIEQGRATLALEPDFAFALFFVGVASIHLGRYDEGLEALERATELAGRGDFFAVRGWALGRAGHHDAARAVLAELERLAEHNPVPPFAFALIHTGLDEHERALELLEQCLDAPTWHLLLVGSDPAFEPLRADPRGQQLLVKLGLAEAGH